MHRDGDCRVASLLAMTAIHRSAATKLLTLLTRGSVL
jgi:hypothetical protein